MGPKGKPKTPKGKQPAVPEENLAERVTRVEKEFFEFTLTDIEKKLNRLDVREEELKTESVKIEEKIEELKKEKGGIITEQEQLLAAKEEQKSQKCNEMNQLADEIRIRIKKYEASIKEWENKCEKMVEKYKEQIAAQEKDIQDLEYHKQNKENHLKELEELELQLQEEEVQHKRDLYEIAKNREKAIMKIKKETQSRIIHYSAEFRKMSQKKIGKPCHRATVENKAIQNLLIQMQEEILEYQKKCNNSKNSLIQFKNEKNAERLEKDKTVARTMIQRKVIKELESECSELREELETYIPILNENKNLIQKYENLTLEIDCKSRQIEETKKNTEIKIEDTNEMKKDIRQLRAKVRSLHLLIRNALKVAEEAMAVRLIPLGKMETEKYLPTETKIRLFKKRRDSVYAKKGKILQYLLDILSKAQLTEEDKKLLTDSTESFGLENVNFSSIYGKMASAEEPEEIEIKKEPEDERQKGPMFFTSLTSLPRSISLPPEDMKTELEDFEGEFEEYGEYDEGAVSAEKKDTTSSSSSSSSSSSDSESEEDEVSETKAKPTKA